MINVIGTCKTLKLRNGTWIHNIVDVSISEKWQTKLKTPKRKMN